MTDGDFHAHCGSMFMAQILRFIGGRPVPEQQAFLRGMIGTLGKWASGETDRRATGWPAPLDEPAPKKRKR